jgi:hypothetical protein
MKRSLTDEAYEAISGGDRFDAGVLTERERCKRVLGRLIEDARTHRPGSPALAWLEHASTAIADGVDPETT